MTFPELIKELDDHNHHVSEATSTIANLDQEQRHIEELISQIEAHFHELQALEAQVLHDQTAQAIHSITEVSDRLLNTSHDAAEGLRHALQQHGTEIDQFVHLHEVEVSKLLSSYHQLQLELEHGVHVAAEMLQKHGALHSHLGQDLHSITTAASQFHQHATDALAHFISNVEGAITHEASQAFAQLKDHIDHAESDQLHHAHTAAEQQATQFHHLFDHLISEAASHLHQEGTKFFHGLEDHLGHQLAAMAEQTFHKLVDQAAHELQEEVMKNEVMMQLGQSTTTALAPILPELKAAEVAVHAIVELKHLL